MSLAPNLSSVSPSVGMQYGIIRSGMSAADNVALATFKSAHDADSIAGAIGVYARSLGAIRAIFSAASQTCVVRLYYFAADADGDEDTSVEPLLGDEITLTGSALLDSSSEYISDTALVTLLDWPLVRLALVTAPSSGTVDLFFGSQG